MVRWLQTACGKPELLGASCLKHWPLGVWASVDAAASQSLGALETGRATQWEALLCSCGVEAEALAQISHARPCMYGREGFTRHEQSSSTLPDNDQMILGSGCVSVRTLYEHTSALSCIWGRGEAVMSGSVEGDVWFHSAPRSGVAFQADRLSSHQSKVLSMLCRAGLA